MKLAGQPGSDEADKIFEETQELACGVIGYLTFYTNGTCVAGN